MSGVPSRPQQCRRWPADVVWLLRTSSVARDAWSCLRASFWCFPDVQAELLRLERENAVDGSTVSCRRWVGRRVALGIERGFGEVAGGPAKGSGWSERPGRDWRGSLGLERISDRSWRRCLRWSVSPVVGEKAEGRGLLEGG